LRERPRHDEAPGAFGVRKGCSGYQTAGDHRQGVNLTTPKPTIVRIR
jgi:hypothetical protein